MIHAISVLHEKYNLRDAEIKIKEELGGPCSTRVGRLVQAGWRKGENLYAVIGDPDGVLELSRQGSIARHGGPTIGQHFHVWATEIDHRLDREEHAGLEHDAFARPTDVHDVRFVMK